MFNKWLNGVQGFLSSSSQAPFTHPPIFIIGAPRSGSTLLYQVMLNYFDFGYLSNLHCLFHGAVPLVERLVHIGCRSIVAGYQSQHGFVQGRFAPSECGDFWYLFFRRHPQYVSMEETDPRSMKRLRKTLRAIIHTMNKPILFKNMPCALRLQPLFKALPEALFIYIKRDLLKNSHSLLKVRKQLHGDYETWWSMEPPDIDHLRTLPVHQQVVEQVRSIQNLIERDSTVVGKDRFFEIRYEDLCNDVFSTMKSLEAFFVRHDLRLTCCDNEIPASFSMKEEISIAPKLYEKLRHYVTNL